MGGGSLAQLWVKLGLIDNLTAGLNKTKSNLQTWGKNLTDAGRKLTLGVTAPLVAGGIAAVKWASDLNEATSAVGTVFGKSASQIAGFNGSVATSLGLSRDQALAAAAGFGALFQGVGITGDAAVDSSNKLLQASADLGSFFNVPIDQVLADIKSGLVGESEPLRKYGILLSESAVQQRAMADTGKTAADQLTDNEKVMARQEIILEGMDAAQGDFARTSEGLANKTRIVKAQFKDAAAVLGAQLLPVALKAVQRFSKLIESFNKLSPTTKKWILIAAGILAVIGPVLLIFGQLATALAAIITIAPAVGAAFTLMLGPLGLIILAVVALAIAWRKNWFDIQGHTKSAIAAILQFLGPFIGKFLKATETIRYGIKRITDAFQKGGLKAALRELFGAGGGAILKGIGRIASLLPRAIGQLLREFQTGFAPIDAILHNLGAMFQDAGLIIQAIFSGQWGKAFQVGWDLVKRYLTQFMLIGSLLLAVFNAIPWGAIGTALWEGLKSAVAFLVTTGASWLLTKGGELLGSLWSGISGYWDDTVKPWFSGLGETASNAIGDVATSLEDKGIDLFAGLFTGAFTKWLEISQWIGSRPETAVEAIGDVSETLWAKGISLIEGLWDGAGEQWDQLTIWLGTIKDTAADWVGDTSGALWNAGFNLVWGMAQGVYGGVQLVIDAVGYVVSQIPPIVRKLLGIESPSKVMAKLLEAVPQGMVVGMLKGHPWVQRAANQLARAAVPSGIASPAFASGVPGSAAGVMNMSSTGASGPPAIHIHVAGNVHADEDFADLMAEKIGPALVDAFRSRRRSLGAAR